MTRPVALIPSDEALPQLELDANLVRQLAAKALGAVVVSISVSYVRHKPATSCLTLYRIELEDGSETHAYARVTAANEKLKPAAEAALAAPDLRLEILPSHADRRVRGLRAQASPGRLGAMLDRLAYADRRAVYEPAWGRWNVVRYKPERHAVLAGINADGETYYLRLDAGKEGERTAALVRSLRDSVACVAAIGRGLRYSHSFRGVLTDRVPGAPFSAGNPEHAAATARALRELHRCPAAWGAEQAVLPFGSAAQAIAGLQAILPDLRPQAIALTDGILPRLAGSPAPPCLIHGDFDSSQVLVDGPDAHLIDFDKARVGDPIEDAASLIARLAGRSQPQQAGLVARSVAELLEAYQQAQSWLLPREQLSAWVALSLLQMAVEPFRHFQPEWPQRCRHILTLADKALQGDFF